MNRQIVIIGAGPAGIMSAISASKEGNDVILVEKNHTLGKKFLLSGGGRGNITNSEDINLFPNHYFNGGDFLRDAFKCFHNKDLIKFFEDKGINCETEEDGRVFPNTGNSEKFLDVLRKELKEKNVKILYNHSLKKINIKNGKVEDVLLEEKFQLSSKDSEEPYLPSLPAGRQDGPGTQLKTDALILATGGVTYSQTGSTGEVFVIVEKLGHKIVPVRPGLVGLELVGERHKAFQGISLNNVSVTIKGNGNKKFTSSGDVVFTHRGISGPAILSSSGKIYDLKEKGKKVSLSIDFMKDKSEEEVRKWFNNKERVSRNITNIIKEIMPKKIGIYLLEEYKIGDKPFNNLLKKDQVVVIEIIKRLSFDVKNTNPINEAMVTRGGVSIKEIDPKTMMSKKIKNLYFSGEMIDVDGDTGGYNIQAAFSTGYLAGLSVF